MTDNALTLFQLCDSQFPTGSFSHSFGMETYIQNDIVVDPETFSDWLKVYLHEQLVYADGLAAKIVYAALDEEDFDRVWEMDRLLTVQNLARESRDGTQRMGKRMLDAVDSIYDIPIISLYMERLRNKESFGHPAIVFTMLGHHLGVDRKTTVVYYLYSTIVALVQNAVRAIPIGQTAGQKVIHQFQGELKEAGDEIMKLDDYEFGVVSPGLEVSQMQHEHVGIRIFSS
ncbi:urease accessory protein UreF [Salinicoccus carnicancri]|uniref:urease accessory protein UreF n=1 Tax=Salinicoccus carnicancri TaxID=558170 RepID=UPI000309375A|nr:urease accessory protein UreF [Salinicoccus carnicancri]